MTRRSFLESAFGLGLMAGCQTFDWAALGAPRLKLGVLSDIHLRKAGDEATLLKALAYFRDHGADGVLVAGDIADNGMIFQLKMFADAWNQVFPNDTAPDGRHVEKLFVYGNHDYCNGYDPKEKKFRVGSIGENQGWAKVWEATFHEPYSDYWLKFVKGVPIVGAHWNGSDQFEGLHPFLKAHQDELDPSKPMIYTQHAHPKDTVFGPWAWGHDNGSSTCILASYPKAVAFTGHSHYSLVDERSVWQGSFTSINTSSLRYASTDFSLRENVCGNTDGYRGDRDWRLRRTKLLNGKTEDGRGGMLVSVWDDLLVVERREFVYGESLGDDWVIPLPATGADAPWSFARRAAKRVAPQFAAGARPTVSFEELPDWKLTHINVTFPAARPVRGCRVNDYEVTAILVEDDVELVQTQRRMVAPDSYKPLSQLDKTVTFTIAKEDLPLKGHYRFEVRPVECFGKKGEKIVSDIVEIV